MLEPLGVAEQIIDADRRRTPHLTPTLAATPCGVGDPQKEKRPPPAPAWAPAATSRPGGAGRPWTRLSCDHKR